MQKKLVLVASAALTVGGLAFVGAGRCWADEPSNTGSNPQHMDMSNKGTAQLPAGIEKSQKDDSNNIRSTLADACDAALKNNNLEKFVTYFSKTDRDRLEPQMKQWSDDAVWNGRLNQFHKDWKAKYGHDFKIDSTVAFGPQFQGFYIVQGEVTNPTMLSNWPVENKTSGEMKGEMKEMKEQMKGEMKGDMHTGHDMGGTTGGMARSDIQKGWQVALVSFPAGHDLPEVNVSMVQEGGSSWRLNIPQNIDAKKLHDNLLGQITYFDEHPDRWPADVNDAYRMASHRIACALYDVNTGSPEQPVHMMNVTPDQNKSGDQYNKDENKSDQNKDQDKDQDQDEQD